jgi:hypothetical protein
VPSSGSASSDNLTLNPSGSFGVSGGYCGPNSFKGCDFFPYKIQPRDVLSEIENKALNNEIEVEKSFRDLPEKYGNQLGIPKHHLMNAKLLFECSNLIINLENCLNDQIIYDKQTGTAFHREPKRKLKINACKVSGTRKNITKINVRGNKWINDDDCTNGQIDLEECMIRTNGQDPCKLPEKDFGYKYQKLYYERIEKLISILEKNDYKIEKIQRDSQDIVERWRIKNFKKGDKKYQSLLKMFSNEILGSYNSAQSSSGIDFFLFDVGGDGLLFSNLMHF